VIALHQQQEHLHWRQGNGSLSSEVTSKYRCTARCIHLREAQHGLPAELLAFRTEIMLSAAIYDRLARLMCEAMACSATQKAPFALWLCTIGRQRK